MTFGYWNVKGCGRKNVLAEIKDFCVVNKINVMVLSETKTQSPPTSSAVARCGFSDFDFIPTIGLSGGLWIMWKYCNVSPFSLVVSHKSSRFIACDIKYLLFDNSITDIFIYAPARDNQKDQFWHELIEFTSSLNNPLFILGDFNEISNANDKCGGKLPSQSRYCRMDNLKSMINCVEIPFTGTTYTWRKKKYGDDNILERLDKGVASSDCLAMFPNTSIHHHIFSSSNHCQISLSLHQQSNTKRVPPFRFGKDVDTEEGF